MSETNTITRPEFRAYQRDVDGRLGAVQKGIEALADEVKKLNTPRAWIFGSLTVLGSALGSGIVTALHNALH
ncbi:hypothetical protein ACLEIY_10180 [Acetobacter tropicalis]|uniref:hypothetical protein n=1 Tax=Acetobacter tropicalis TaxID=104102 RepID=UPI0039761891